MDQPIDTLTYLRNELLSLIFIDNIWVKFFRMDILPNECHFFFNFKHLLHLIYYSMIKINIFSDISFQMRVMIYLHINSKLAICLSICQQNVAWTQCWENVLVSLYMVIFCEQIDRHIANLELIWRYILTLI